MCLGTAGATDLTALTPATEVTATVTDARESDSGSRLIVETGAPIRVKAIVYIRSAEALFHKGDIIRFNGLWERPDAAPDIPCEFSMAPYCFREGIAGICHADRFSVVAAGGHEPSWTEKARERAAYAIRESGVDSQTADLLEGILIGNTDAIDGDVRERFSEAGLAHMLALSGTHLAVITAFLSLQFIPFRLGGKRQWGWLATMAAMWGYVVLTGAPSSVVRAAVMASFVIAGRVAGLPTSGLNSLCAAALAILLFSPAELYSPGFQMSFLAVAGILMFAPRLVSRRVHNPLLRLLNSWGAVCVSAVVATGGVSAWLFHRFPTAFLVSNLPAALLLPLFMVGGIALIFLSMAGIKAAWLAVSLDWLSRMLNGVAETTNSLWWHQVDGIWFPAWTLAFYYGSLLLLYLAVERRGPIFACSAAIMAVTFVGLCAICAPRPPSRELYRVRDPFCTAWVVFDDGRAWLLSDAPDRHKEALRGRIAWRIREPLAIRNIDSLRTAPDSIQTPFFRKSGNRAVAGETDIVFIDRTSDVVRFDRRPRYAVVGGHYRHNIKAVAELVNPDTIILSPSLDYEIEKKFAARLDSSGVNYLQAAYRYWK